MIVDHGLGGGEAGACRGHSQSADHGTESGKNKQNAVKSMVVTDADGRLLCCSPAEPASSADITHARTSGLVRAGPLRRPCGGDPRRCRLPRARRAPDWYEEIHERRRKAHSSRCIHVEHGIAHLKNWASPRRHHGRREYMRDIIQAVAALLSHQQAFTLASDERV
ncbi:transposase family protein [Streptomyces sp. NPDC006668]|uniref:transposase family protein n=1 Tax=Streptomyces sp. NPDC006668 TaxID=3156903 RepID=UPI00340CC4FB